MQSNVTPFRQWKVNQKGLKKPNQTTEGPQARQWRHRKRTARFSLGRCKVIRESATSKTAGSARTRQRSLTFAEGGGLSVLLWLNPNRISREDLGRQHRKQDLIENHRNGLNYLCTSSDLIYRIYGEGRGERSREQQKYRGVEILPHEDTSLKCRLQLWKDKSGG